MEVIKQNRETALTAVIKDFFSLVAFNDFQKIIISKAIECDKETYEEIKLKFVNESNSVYVSTRNIKIETVSLDEALLQKIVSEITELHLDEVSLYRDGIPISSRKLLNERKYSVMPILLDLFKAPILASYQGACIDLFIHCIIMSDHAFIEALRSTCCVIIVGMNDNSWTYFEDNILKSSTAIHVYNTIDLYLYEDEDATRNLIFFPEELYEIERFNAVIENMKISIVMYVICDDSVEEKLINKKFVIPKKSASISSTVVNSENLLEKISPPFILCRKLIDMIKCTQ